MNIIEKVFALMIDGCIVLNTHGDIMAVNRAYSNMSGYSEDELLKMNLKELEALQNESQIQDEIKKVIEGGTLQFESVHKKKSGETFIIEVNVTSGYENGEIYLISTIRDITNKKNTEEQLKTSDKFFNCSLDMLCLAGFDGYFKVLNPAWEKILGWSTEELLSKPWIEFVFKEDKNATDNIKTVIVDGQKVYQFENRYVCKNGEIKWLSWNSFPCVEENIMFGVARDITARKHLEESLRESENSYRLLFENMEEAFAVHKIIYDSSQIPIDYIFLDINPFFESFTGLKKEDIIGKRVKEVLPDTENFWI